MRLVLDPETCTGHGRCYALAPEVYDADDEGHCVLRHDVIPVELESKARSGVNNCPEEALSITD